MPRPSRTPAPWTCGPCWHGVPNQATGTAGGLIDEKIRDEAAAVLDALGLTVSDTFGVPATARKGGAAQSQAEGPTFGVPAAAAAVYVDAASVLVRPEVARAQLDAERARSAEASGTEAGVAGAGTGTGTGLAGSGEASGRPPPADGIGPVGRPVDPPPPRRFFGTVRLDPGRAGRDMGTVAEEVLQHLTTLPGAEVEVSVEISAKVPEGSGRGDRQPADTGNAPSERRWLAR